MSTSTSMDVIAHSDEPLSEGPLAMRPSLSTWRTPFLVIGNEIYKGLLTTWSYKFNLFMESIMLIMMFIGITFFAGGGELRPERLPPTLLGFIVTFFAMNAIGTMSYNLQQEAQQGTLEQWYMSPVPASVVQLGRTLTTFVVSIATLIPISIPLIWMFDIQIPWRWQSIPVFIILLLGVYGFGFAVGGATMLFKQIGPLANMVQNLLLFLNGAFLPVEQFPGLGQTIAHTLPTTQGIILMRRIIFDDETLGQLLRDGSLMWLIIHSAFYFIAGVLIFTVAERAARRRGLLAQY